ncbi:hypothetical protein FM996_20690 [Methylosinus sporium]|uniref:MBOAT family protein n=1 Tax=Methylosinus sporium TaxID=428 RepID=A0A549SCY1_METSR|nr:MULTISPECIES: MBOAT family O-acyltransferase [Methylosinus]MBU3891031.1 hypothetical protein [Methylosinus sp. KRF6]TRL23897.1 hypothetical protein FM996_20690 [Methylosinus sporium]
MSSLFFSTTAIYAVIYCTAAIFICRALPKGEFRGYSFAVLNMGFTYILFFASDEKGAIAFGLSVLALAAIWVVIEKARCLEQSYWQLAFFAPLLWLCLSKSLGIFTIVGLSYLSFRVAHLVWEVQLKRVCSVPFDQYLCHLFFVPTYLLGPISPFSYFHASFNRLPEYAPPPVSEAGLRILKGLVKFVVIAGVFQQMSADNYLSDYRAHQPLELVLAAFGFYVFLYANFSGANDVSIGMSALMGILVKENFDRPYLATSCTEFWKRWHVSLSEWMRDIVFSPLVGFLVRHFRRLPPIHAVAVSFMVVFLLIGWWHGNGWQFWSIGFLFGAALVVEHYADAVVRHYRLDKGPWSTAPGFRYLKVVMTNTYVALVVSLMSINWEEKGIGLGDLFGRVTAFVVK